MSTTPNIENVAPELLQQIFRERARTLAARRETAAAAEETWPGLVFSLRGERFCLPLSALVEVLPFAGHTPIPGAPPELLGVVNIRSEIRAVLDLAQLLKLPAATAADVRGYIVLVRRNGCEVGLRVDELERIENVAPSACTAIGDEGELPAARRVRTLGRATVLSVDEILDTNPKH